MMQLKRLKKRPKSIKIQCEGISGLLIRTKVALRLGLLILSASAKGQTNQMCWHLSPRAMPMWGSA